MNIQAAPQEVILCKRPQTQGADHNNKGLDKSKGEYHSHPQRNHSSSNHLQGHIHLAQIEVESYHIPVPPEVRGARHLKVEMDATKSSAFYGNVRPKCCISK